MTRLAVVLHLKIRMTLTTLTLIILGTALFWGGFNYCVYREKIMLPRVTEEMTLPRKKRRLRIQH